jgi:hypothetical protein
MTWLTAKHVAITSSWKSYEGRSRTYVALIQSQNGIPATHLVSESLRFGADSNRLPTQTIPMADQDSRLGEKESNPRRRGSKPRLDASNHLQSVRPGGFEPPLNWLRASRLATRPKAHGAPCRTRTHSDLVKSQGPVQSGARGKSPRVA